MATIRYYLNSQHITGWDEKAEGNENLDAVLDAAEDNLTDYQPGDMLTIELDDGTHTASQSRVLR